MPDSVLITVLILLFAYTAGALNTAYYLPKKFKHIDIRDYFSGNAGATNVQRVLGNNWFAIIAGADILKGFLLVIIIKYFAAGLAIPALLAAILGHCYPAQLRLRGGRGAAILIGGTIAASALLALTMASLFIILYLVSTRYRFSAIITFALLPIGGLMFLDSYTDILILALTVVAVTHNYLAVRKTPKH